MYVTLDFETFWDSRKYTLSRMGPVEYIRDPRFEVQLVALVEGVNPDPAKNRARVWDGSQADHVLGSVNAMDNVVWFGHNIAGFDALILSERFGIHPKNIIDTIALMNWTGVSRLTRRSHAACTKFFGTGEKKEGTVVSDGRHWPFDFSEEERKFFTKYCADDARQCAANAARMLPYVTQDALRFMSITARMATEPVFVLDEERLRKYIGDIDAAVEKSRQDVMSIFRFPDEASFLKAVRSAPRFAAMLVYLGVQPPMKESEAKTKTLRAQLEALYDEAPDAATRQAVSERMARDLPVMTFAFSKQDLDFLALREHPDYRVQLLVNARLEHNSSINRSRAERFLVFARHHKPVPVTLSAFNAHTGRYTAGAADEGSTSDRLQFQNLSKRDPTKARLREAIRAPEGYKVVACDSSQVEARCLAWAANETGLVAQFREGRDPYSELAEMIFGVPADEIKYGAKHGDKRLKRYRTVAKTAILSAGYGTSAKRFSDTLLRSGVRMADDLDKHHEMARNAHAIYRAAHPNIVQFWHTHEQVLEDLCVGGHGFFGGPDNRLYEYGPMSVCDVVEVPSIKLPSGFILRYPNLRHEIVDGKDVMVYDSPKGNTVQRLKIYGASATNNTTQSLAFQILVWQACRMDEAGIRIACNIHDSFATVVPSLQAENIATIMLRWMKTCPPWAETLPIDAETEIGDDFGVV